MKLLVSGCSFSSGFGFNSDILERNWPNQLATLLNANLTNVARPGHDNPGIFISFMEQIAKEDFDVCLLQISAIDRIMFSPNWNGPQLCGQLTKQQLLLGKRTSNISNGAVSDSQYQLFYKTFLVLNQHAEHWNRLLKIINIVQQLNKQEKYIRFVNGLLNWDQELFIDPVKSEFLNRLIDIDNISDNDIDRLRTLVYNQTKSIDLNLWINPFSNFLTTQIDNISSDDNHPGLKSHDMYTKLIFNYLKDNINA